MAGAGVRNLALSAFMAMNSALLAASPAADATLQYLQGVSGHRIVAGQHNYLDVPADSENAIHRITGKFPGLWGCDFGYGHSPADLARARAGLVAEAKRQHAAGRLITLCWHQVMPTDAESAGWNSVQGRLSEEQMRDVVTPGTALYGRWLAQVDDVAAYLRQLQAADVPVLWRPYHEGNAPWFWWGGRAAAYQKLWINLHDRLAGYHHLDNLIWVLSFDQKGSPRRDYLPADRYVDVLGVDVYHGFDAAAYDELLALAHGRPIAVTECGALPDLKRLEQDFPSYCYFMIWPSFIDKLPPPALRAFYNDAWTVTCPNPEKLSLPPDHGVIDPKASGR